MKSSISFLTLLVGLSVLALSAQAFRMNSGFGLTKRTSNALHMSTPGGTVSQVTGAMPNANEYLEILEPGLKKATLGMFQAVKEIAYKIRTVQCDKYTCYVQERGEMVPVDLVANQIIFGCLLNAGSVCTGSSEENPTEDEISPTGMYSTVFTPLSGAAVLDTNAAAGSIWGTYDSRKIIGCKGRDLKVAAMATYGPRTSITLAMDGIDYVHEFILVDDFSARHGEWVKVDEFTTIDEGRIFSPGNLAATVDNEGYKALFDFWNMNQYQLSFTGGMVSDVNQIVVKGNGIFANPDSATNPSKLKLAYEAAPLAFIIEKAGGLSSNGVMSLLEVPITDLEQDTPAAMGSMGEVKRYDAMVGGN